MHFERQEGKILELHRQNLDELLKKRLNHEEPPWRTPVTKDDEIEWKMKTIRLKPCDDLDGGSDEKGRGNWTPEKKKWRTLGTRIYSLRTNSEEKD